MSPALGSTTPELQTPGGAVTNLSRLVGVWSLVSFSIIDETGRALLHPMGQDPQGMLVYTADGHMSAHLFDPNRYSPSADTAPSAETADRVDVEAVTRDNAYVGYGGTFECRGDVVVHHVRVASVPQWIATQQVRRFELHGTVLTLCSPTMRTGGHEQTPCLVWRRLSGPA
ncbi:lipocalin-like domain-containing protein [Streptomyces sp. AK02-04a]|uniref:lipocalin-like domain-containing protein n=1 Tax=Streptomyces sp. AK02-04a TaxID=3028649 RepID=UPI0029B270B9|nr:lipocalin-like domain-containing protein [Streptomyces sp. AK02-04a]MDX3763910.1 lipocalin-like domain-containing protein [Streptomyces sp. AK02-04a]